MAKVGTWDGANRRIILLPGVTSFHPIDDIYREYRIQRRTVEAFRKWDPFMEASGNEPKGGGKFTSRFLRLLNGVKIVPDDVSHTLAITGEVLTDDQTSAFDLTSLSAASKVVLEYTPPDTEIIEVATGGQDPATLAAAVWAALVDGSLSAGDLMIDARKFRWNRRITDPSTGVETFYDDDDIAIFRQGNVYEGVTTGQPYRGQGAERRDKK